MRTTTRILGSLLLVFLCGCVTSRLHPDSRAAIRTVSIEPVAKATSRVSGELPSAYDVASPNPFYGSLITAPLGIFYEIFHYRAHQRRKSKKLTELLLRCGVDVPHVVREEFFRQLSRSYIFKDIVMAPLPIDTSVLDDDLDAAMGAPGPAGAAGEARVVNGVHGEESANEPARIEAAPIPIDADARLVIEVSYGVTAVSMMDETLMPWIHVRAHLEDPDGRKLWRASEHVSSSEGDLRELPFPDPFQSHDLVRRNYETAARIAVRRLVALLEPR